MNELIEKIRDTSKQISKIPDSIKMNSKTFDLLISQVTDKIIFYSNGDLPTYFGTKIEIDNDLKDGEMK